MPVGCLWVDRNGFYNILNVPKLLRHSDLQKIDWYLVKLHPSSNRLPVGCMRNVFGSKTHPGGNQLPVGCMENVFQSF